MAWPELISLHGNLVSVVPLDHTHREDLAEAVADGALHKLWYTPIPAPDDMAEEIAQRLKLREAGSWVPFAVIETASDKAIGMTNYLNIDAANRRLEIGGTWYRSSAQRSGVNSECKYLLLTHAFEKLECNAVEFRTHVINHRSRQAIERLGAKFDGILRSHMIMANGTLRDTCVYSIIAPEWPTVKAHLSWRMEQRR